jgi:hypothetical protein
MLPTAVAAAALLALVGTACTTATEPKAGNVLTRAQADSVAQVVTADLDAVTQGATFSPVTGVPFAAPEPGMALTSPPSATCPTISPNPPTNSDGDRVPDSVRFDFTGCSFAGREASITLSGTIDIVDPTATTTDIAIKTVYTDFTRALTAQARDRSWSVKQNGTRMFIGSGSTLQAVEKDFRTDYTYGDGSTASHVKNWTATFTADVAGSIRPDFLPSGVWNVLGSSTFTRGTRSHALTVKTDPALHYNAACTVRPKFDAGTLTAEVTRSEGTTVQHSTVTIQFTACGQYTVTRT